MKKDQRLSSNPTKTRNICRRSAGFSRSSHNMHAEAVELQAATDLCSASLKLPSIVIQVYHSP